MSITIANGQGFWGDRDDAAPTLLQEWPKLDYLTLDYLAELSLSIMAIQRQKDLDRGYARDFLAVIALLIPFWKQGHPCKVITNAGGLAPKRCAEEVRKQLASAGLKLSVASISGDDVLDKVSGKRPLLTANAYLGAAPIASALQKGANIVVTGRTADPSLAVGACMHAFGWQKNDYQRLAQATIAGHLIECGTQVTGGISTNWMEVPHPERIGYPVVEIEESGNFVVTKSSSSGGLVTEETVKEQLLYEIGNPFSYLSPDCTVSLETTEVLEEQKDRVRVQGVLGKAPTESYKVSCSYQAGWSCSGTLTIVGEGSLQKAKRAGEVLFTALKERGAHFEEQIVQCIAGERETLLYMAVRSEERSACLHFARSIAPLVTAGPPGTTGYATGRPKVRPALGYLSDLIPKEQVEVEVAFE